MSRSTIICVDKDFKNVGCIEFKNSWLFSPIVFDIMYQKYLPHMIKTYDFGDGETKSSFITDSMFNKDLFGVLNEKLNNSNDLDDRILWELANQQVFEKKDYPLVAKAIKHGLFEFIEQNDNYGSHIAERWMSMANTIEKIQDKYIVHKNTSCDDSVEVWFAKYDEEDNYAETSMLESDYRDQIEFIKINDGQMTFSHFDME